MYDLILRDVETVFGSSAWTVNNIKTYPTNYLGNKKSNNEYVLMNVLPSLVKTMRMELVKRLQVS